MKKALLLIIIFMVAAVSGCSTVDVKENLITLNSQYFPATDAGKMDVREKSFSNLQIAHDAVLSKSPQKAGAGAAENIIPGFMVEDPLIGKIVDVAYKKLVVMEETEQKITKQDVESFVKMVSDNYGAGAADESVKARIHDIIKKYLIVYYSDSKRGFVDREGTVYKKQEIKNNIGNDIITAMVAIVLEGFFDGVLEVPVFTDITTFQTSENAQPTANRLGYADSELIVENGQAGIDKYELKAIRYLSGLAADQSKTLSGMALRSFGDLEIGLVIAGHYSVGDNDTLSKVLDTIFEICSKRVVEAESYLQFKKFTWNKDQIIMAATAGDDDRKALTANTLIRDLVEIDEADTGK